MFRQHVELAVLRGQRHLGVVQRQQGRIELGQQGVGRRGRLQILKFELVALGAHGGQRVAVGGRFAG